MFSNYISKWGGIFINKNNNNVTTTKNPDLLQPSESSKTELQALYSTLSHEIKAPVRAIDGYARIFLEDYSSQIDSEGISLITNIREICSDTLLLMNKLLEYTRFTEFEPIQEAIDLKQMIFDVFQELRLSYSDKKMMKLTINEAIPCILADRILMKQVITNILSNSLKFTNNNHEILIDVGYRLEQNEHTFFIQDNGVGFDMKFSENLFGMFQRMHSIDDFEGSGVGLAIVKKIIQKFGGRVWITGAVGQGACVSFTLSSEHILT